MRGVCDVDVAVEAVEDPGFADRSARDRLGMMLWLLLEARWPGCTWTVEGPVCFVTLSVALTERARLADHIAEVIEQATTTTGIELRAAIASTASDQSRFEAAKALAALRRRTDGKCVADVERGDPIAVLAATRALVAGWTHLRSPKLDLLRRHDAQHGTAYIASLQAYLDSFGDIAATSRKLGVPMNTARYRVRRAVAIAALDFGDTDERLACAVELTLG